MSVTYKPRNDFVIFRTVKVDKVRGIAMPDFTEEGEEYRIVACGPKVENLQVDDKVHIIGKFRENWMLLPGSCKYGITRETNIAVVYEDDGIVTG